MAIFNSFLYVYQRVNQRFTLSTSGASPVGYLGPHAAETRGYALAMPASQVMEIVQDIYQKDLSSWQTNRNVWTVDVGMII